MKKFLWSFGSFLIVVLGVYASEITVGPFVNNGTFDYTDANAIITGANDNYDRTVTNAANISANTSGVAANLASLASNTSDVATNDGRLDTIEGISGIVKVSGGTPSAATAGTDYLVPGTTSTITSDIPYYFGSGEGAVRLVHVSADNAFYITPYDGGVWDIAKQIVWDSDVGDWEIETELKTVGIDSSAAIKIDGETIIDEYGNVKTTGSISGAPDGRIITTPEDLVEADLNTIIFLNLSATADFGIPSCTAARAFNWIQFRVVNATHVASLYPLESDELFVLKDNTPLTANYELDLTAQPPAGGENVTILCDPITPGRWLIWNEDSTSIDGGVQD